MRQTLLNLQKPPPPPNTGENKDGDVDFRIPPPSIGAAFPVDFNPLELPPILQQTSIGDIAKLLVSFEMISKDSYLIKIDWQENTIHDKSGQEPPRKKQKGENGDDQFGSDDMEMSDEDEYQKMSGEILTIFYRVLFLDLLFSK